MKRSILILLALIGGIELFSQCDYTKYVMPIIGSQSESQLSNGNTYPCIARPWGMNHWTPQTSENRDRWQYSYNANHITGLKQTHQPSPWVGDYGVFSLMPTVGEKVFLEKDRRSWFSHKSEKIEPAYYSVYLADYDVIAEMAPTERGCVMQFTFPDGVKSNVVLDAFAKASYIKIIPEEKKIVGYSTDSYGFDEGKPTNFKNYFTIVFDKPFTSYALWENNKLVDGKKETNTTRGGAILTFNTQHKEIITARIASSFISQEQAELNLNREIGKKSFEQIKKESKDIWNAHLSRFEVIDNEADDLDKLRFFYSALYRILLYPREFHEYDVNNNIFHYSPFNGKIETGRMYTDNGFWDTFRAVHPFFNLFYPEFSKHYLEGLANIYKESGWLPEWTSPGHIDCMIGSNSSSVVASSIILNNITDVDKLNTLWESVYKNAYNAHPTLISVGRAGIKEYDKLGYVPNDIGIKESAARTLEYAYNDYCVLKLGEYMKKDKKTLDVFAKRSLNYKNIFHPYNKLMAGKDSKGSYRKDFNPFAWGGDFTEGNSWHYTWSALHDPVGLAQLMGGKKQMATMLDSVFVLPPVFDESAYGEIIHEIREMQIMNFGQYAHGNQPVQHMIYLYNWVNQPWKAQYWAREIMRRLYRPTPDGYCGDEDNGQTSAWYVMSAMGFYSVCPVQGEYAIGSPLFKSIKVTLPNGNKLEISAPDNSDENIYVDRIDVNNSEYNKNYFTHQLLQKGGQINFIMSNKPNTSRNISDSSQPFSYSSSLIKPN